MRVLLPLLFLGLSTGQEPRPAPARQVQWEPRGLFDPHLPECMRLRRTRGSLCAIAAAEAFWLDALSLAEASPMTLDEEGCTLVDAASWGKRSAELRSARDGSLCVVADLGDGWRPRPMPEELVQRARSRPLRARSIAGAGDMLVFCSTDSIYRLERDHWSRVPLALGDKQLSYAPDHALLEGRRLYLGMDGFEGQLIVADIDTGVASVASDAFPPGPTCVTSLAFGPEGKLYVACRQRPLLGTQSRVLIREGETWRVLLCTLATSGEAVCGWTLSIDEARNAELASEKGHATARVDGYTLPSTNFLALRFDEHERPCVLSDSLGILRRAADGTWGCITPGWAESGATACDLEFVGHTAVLASRTAGVVLLDLETLEGKRVRPRGKY